VKASIMSRAISVWVEKKKLTMEAK
jgi:hypothetical protein